MGMCKDCSKVANSLDMIDGLCPDCQDPMHKEKEALKKERHDDFKQNKYKKLKSIMITSETMVNLEIESRIEVISVSRIYGLNFIKDFFAGIRDFVGGRIASLEEPLQRSHKEIIDEMKEVAYFAGGNAIIGFRIEHTYSGASVLSVFATGTVVKIKE